MNSAIGKNWTVSTVLTALIFTLFTAADFASAQTLTVLHEFVGGANDGGNPQQSGLLFLGGSYYGVALFGGTANDGVAYRLAPGSNGTWQVTVLYSFQGGNDGSIPLGTLIADASGNLYGVTVSGGGPQNGGTAFKLSKSSTGQWEETILHSFGVGSDGSGPFGPLVFDTAGNLYGSTTVGGDSGAGTAFELSPAADGTWTETVLHSFGSSPDGSVPAGGLVLDAAGNLYGVTSWGGANPCAGLGCGVAFELSRGASGWTEKIIHNFAGGGDGFDPNGPLIIDQSGNLYGTTQFGGGFGKCSTGKMAPSCGTVYELSPASDGTWTETILHAFVGGSLGSKPSSPVAFDANGNLYGETGQFGNDAGTVYRLAPTSSGGWRLKILAHFDGSDGANPEGGVLIRPGHVLYGTTIYGGAKNSGVAFRVTP